MKGLREQQKRSLDEYNRQILEKIAEKTKELRVNYEKIEERIKQLVNITLA